MTDLAEKTSIPAPGRSPAKRIIVTLIKVAIAAAAVWWVTRSLTWGDTAQGEPGLQSILARTREKWYLLVAAWVILLFPFLVTAKRWQALLRPQGIHIPFWKSLQLTFVGQFYSIILPGITGGDLVKIVYAARLTGSKTKSIITVILDRVIGLVALMVIGGISAGWQYFAYTERHETLKNIVLFIAMALGTMVIGCVIYFSRRLRTATGMQRLIDHPQMPPFVKKADSVLHEYRGHCGLLIWAFGISLVSQFALPVSAWLAGMALGIDMHLGYYLAYIPMAILGASLPGLPQAVGYLELIVAHFFFARGTATISQAFALTQAVRFLPILWNLMGAYWVITGKFSRHQAIEDEKQLAREE
ncbi:MAG: flippase-like domain-containing protein [Phycisphaerales bacterium]|nr:flippase-like domain-containing protein [Phycisphaerales bacterium]